MRPRVLIDIRNSRKTGIFRISGFKINLNRQRVIYIPLKPFLRITLALLVISSFIFGSVIAPTGGNNLLTRAAQNNVEREALETELARLEDEIAKQETLVGEYKKQGTTLKKEIERLEAKIYKINLQIKAINLSLAKLDKEIVSTQTQIVQTESDIVSNKKNLSNALHLIYQNDNKNLVEIFLANEQLSDFFGDLNNFLAVQDSLRVVLRQVIEMRQKLVDQKEVLALERADATTLKEYQDNQKVSIKETQTEKKELLKVTKGKESQYQELLVKTKKTAAEIRKQIFKLLGGGELEFEEAYKLAKFAEEATGVRAALILAVLDRESALGKNVGRCDYQKAMHPTRDKPVFLEIIQELGLEKNLESGVIKVSCANADGAFGGAMGPAQFIPSTWNLYKDQIAQITGNKPPSPWTNLDAFVATALYLKDAGAANASLAKERAAAAKYYAGSRWKNYLWTYGARVVSQAQRFQDDINILSS